MRDLLRDAVRSLAHDRRFTVVAVALLAVTIGLVTAVYAIVHAVVLRPFPFANQDRVAVIWQRDDRRALPVSASPASGPPDRCCGPCSPGRS